jgi:hypothetical protein
MTMQTTGYVLFEIEGDYDERVEVPIAYSPNFDELETKANELNDKRQSNKDKWEKAYNFYKSYRDAWENYSKTVILKKLEILPGYVPRFKEKCDKIKNENEKIENENRKTLEEAEKEFSSKWWSLFQIPTELTSFIKLKNGRITMDGYCDCYYEVKEIVVPKIKL